MLVIKAELWPGGSEYHKQTLGRMTVVNDETGTDERGNYQILLMSLPELPMIVGRVIDFPRKDNHVWDLVYEALEGMLHDPTVDSYLGKDEVGKIDTGPGTI